MMKKELRKQITVDGVEYVAHHKKGRKDAYSCDGCVFQNYNKYHEEKFDCVLHPISEFCWEAADKGYRVWFERKHKV